MKLLCRHATLKCALLIPQVPWFRFQLGVEFSPWGAAQNLETAGVEKPWLNRRPSPASGPEAASPCPQTQGLWRRPGRPRPGEAESSRPECWPHHPGALLARTPLGPACSWRAWAPVPAGRAQGQAEVWPGVPWEALHLQEGHRPEATECPRASGEESVPPASWPQPHRLLGGLTSGPWRWSVGGGPMEPQLWATSR